jgi:hypothetical protein
MRLRLPLPSLFFGSEAKFRLFTNKNGEASASRPVRRELGGLRLILSERRANPRQLVTNDRDRELVLSSECFLIHPHSVGKAVSDEIPLPSTPRHCGQFVCA